LNPCYRRERAAFSAFFLGFLELAISGAIKSGAEQLRRKLLDVGFKRWQEDHSHSARQFPGLPYYLLHSFSYLLLSSVALECGYPASSLRERVLASNGRFGVLIYTGSSDARERGAVMSLGMSRILHAAEPTATRP